MQVRLRVRISLRKKRVQHVVVTKEDVIDTIKRIRSNFSDYPLVVTEKLDLREEEEINSFASDFKASISVIKPTSLIDLGFKQNSVQYVTEIKHISVVNLELGKKLADNEPAKSMRFLTIKANWIMAAILNKLSHINSDCDMIFVKNNYNKTESVIVEPNKFRLLLKSPLSKQVLTTKDKNENKYRLYLDGIMLIERIYPMELSRDEMLEELLFVNINKGNHKFTVEMLTNDEEDEFVITDLAIEDQIFSKINAKSCSVEFR